MIKRKDGRWQDQVKLPGMKTPKYFYGKSQAEVKKKMAAFRAEQERGPLLETCMDQWQAWHETQISPSSVRAYDQPVKDVKEYFGGRYLRDVRADEVDAFLRWMAAKDFARRTVQKRLNCLNMMYDYAILQRWTDHNPCAPVKLPKNVKRDQRREPPSDEVLEAVERAEKKDGGLFAYLLLYTGLRRGELLGLRWDDFDREAGVIHIRRSVYYEGDLPRLKTPKTEAGEREVWILDKLEPILRKPGRGYIFGGVSPLTLSEFNHLWYDFCKDHGWLSATRRPTVSPHQFRHAYATMLFEADIPELDAKEVMGHSSIRVTHDIYTHIRNKRRAESAGKLNAYLNSDCHPPVKPAEVIELKRKN